MGKEITPTLVSGQYKMSGNTQDGLSVITYRKKGHPQNSEQGQGYEETMINDTLNIYDNTETRTPTLVCERKVYDWRRLNARATELKDVCVTAMANWGWWWKQYAVCTGARHGKSSKKINTVRV